MKGDNEGVGEGRRTGANYRGNWRLLTEKVMKENLGK